MRDETLSLGERWVLIQAEMTGRDVALLPEFRWPPSPPVIHSAGELEETGGVRRLLEAAGEREKEFKLVK